jgi:hypothetical protein
MRRNKASAKTEIVNLFLTKKKKKSEAKGSEKSQARPIRERNYNILPQIKNRFIKPRRRTRKGIISRSAFIGLIKHENERKRNFEARYKENTVS